MCLFCRATPPRITVIPLDIPSLYLHDQSQIPTMALTAEEYRKAVPEGHSIIHVRNLSSRAVVGTDAWGRRTEQPILISARVSLQEPFESAAKSDVVNKSTVHYGMLSKAILKAVEHAAELYKGREARVDFVVDTIWHALTGESFARIKDSSDEGVLDTALLQSLELTLMLPKGSLLGRGVSYTYQQGFVEQGGIVSTPSRQIMKIHDLQVPTLVGVNPNERLAKQVVVANIEIENPLLKSNNELEQIVTKVRRPSSPVYLKLIILSRPWRSHPLRRLSPWEHTSTGEYCATGCILNQILLLPGLPSGYLSRNPVRLSSPMHPWSR